VDAVLSQDQRAPAGMAVHVDSRVQGVRCVRPTRGGTIDCVSAETGGSRTAESAVGGRPVQGP
jgi:hypothetical protein